MDPRQVATTDDVRQPLEERGLKQIKVGVFDIDGVMRGKYMARSKFLSSLAGRRLRFLRCGARLGLPKTSFTTTPRSPAGTLGSRRRPGAPVARVSAVSCRSKTTWCSSWANSSGETRAPCARAGSCAGVHRQGARAWLRALRRMRIRVSCCRGTPDCWRTKAGAALAADGRFERRLFGASQFSQYRILSRPARSVRGNGHRPRGPPRGNRTGRPGGGHFRRQGPCGGATRPLLFKTFAKVLAQRQGRNVSFMAKWDPKMPGPRRPYPCLAEEPVRRAGCSTTLRSPTSISQTMRHFIGGVQSLRRRLGSP